MRYTPGQLYHIYEGEYLSRNFHRYVLAAWSALEPATPFVDNWHIGAICEHLQAVAERQILRLIINMPPRFLKSNLVSVLWHTWVWTRWPERRFLTGSYAKDLATRDAVAARRVMETPWYRARFSHVFSFTTDQNVKTRYENDKRGYRVTTSPDSASTGEGGDHLIIDDPVSAREANSEVVRKAANMWWKESMSTRFNDPKTGTAVVVMQRLAQDDMTGMLLEEGGWDHLVLPMRYESEHRKITSLGFVDPRTEEGELLFPARYDEAAVARLEKDLGSYGTAGQLQQRPVPRGGAIFKRGDFKFWTVVPEYEECVLSLDCSFKDLKESDYVALHVWARKGADKFLLYRKRERLSFTQTKLLVEAVYPKFQRGCVAVLIEDKANGPAVIDALRKDNKIPGVTPINPEGGKESRAFAMQPEHEAGNIWVPHPDVDPDIETFLNEATAFPKSAHDDEVDAMTQAINWYRMRGQSRGLFDWYRQQYEKDRAEILAREAALGIPAPIDRLARAKAIMQAQRQRI